MVIDFRDLQYFIATRPAGAIAVLILSFATLLVFVRPVVAALASAFAIIVGTTFPSVDVGPALQIVHTVI